MKAVDTNVLVRFLVEDDEVQLARARRLFRQAVASDEPLFVSEIVLCESVWVLTRTYRLPRKQVASVLSQLVHARHLSFDSPDRVARAAEAFAAGRGDFADYLIREQAREAGCELVCTFDATLLKEAGFQAP